MSNGLTSRLVEPGRGPHDATGTGVPRGGSHGREGIGGVAERAGVARV